MAKDNNVLKDTLTEHVDYKEVDGSIFGSACEEVVNFSKKVPKKGIWTDLCSGDGRYTKFLFLEGADYVIAMDIDEPALDKLRQDTAPEYISQLKTIKHDVTKRFPLEDGSIDGFFSSGSLHLFTKEILRDITDEVYRTLKSGGDVVFDFTINPIRKQPGGELLFYKDEPRYTRPEAEEYLTELFGGKYQIKELLVSHYSDPKGTFRKSDIPYNLECDGISIHAKKI